MWLCSKECEEKYRDCTYCMLDKMLDKIRKRIELEKLGYPPSAEYYKAIIKCLQIIDKYKAENEELRNKYGR